MTMEPSNDHDRRGYPHFDASVICQNIGACARRARLAVLSERGAPISGEESLSEPLFMARSRLSDSTRSAVVVCLAPRGRCRPEKVVPLGLNFCREFRVQRHPSLRKPNCARAPPLARGEN